MNENPLPEKIDITPENFKVSSGSGYLYTFTANEITCIRDVIDGFVLGDDSDDIYDQMVQVANEWRAANYRLFLGMEHYLRMRLSEEKYAGYTGR